MMSKIRYGQSGYVGSSMSVRAAGAHASGEYPATKAAREFGFKNAAAVRRHFAPSSWHHTSKYANATEFFDIGEALADMSPRDMIALLPDMTRAGRADLRRQIIERMRESSAPAEPRRHVTRYKLEVRLGSVELGAQVRAGRITFRAAADQADAAARRMKIDLSLADRRARQAAAEKEYARRGLDNSDRHGSLIHSLSYRLEVAAPATKTLGWRNAAAFADAIRAGQMTYAAAVAAIQRGERP